MTSQSGWTIDTFEPCITGVRACTLISAIIGFVALGMWGIGTTSTNVLTTETIFFIRDKSIISQNYYQVKIDVNFTNALAEIIPCTIIYGQFATIDSVQKELDKYTVNKTMTGYYYSPNAILTCSFNPVVEKNNDAWSSSSAWYPVMIIFLFFFIVCGAITILSIMEYCANRQRISNPLIED